MTNIKINFEKNGYVVVPAKKNHLEKLRKIILNSIKKDKKIDNKLKKFENNSSVFNNFHKFISKKELNNLRFNIYNKINNNIIY